LQHNTEGSSVARALWDEFPTDSITWAIDEQFMWGSALLISPVVEEVNRELFKGHGGT